MDIDLTGQATVKHSYSFSGGDITITFKDSSDVVLGSITVEEVRFRPLMQVLKTNAEQLYNDFAQNIQRSRSTFDVNAGEARTELFS